MKLIRIVDSIMERVTIPIVFLCCVFLIGRVLMSFVFGI